MAPVNTAACLLVVPCGTCKCTAGHIIQRCLSPSPLSQWKAQYHKDRQLQLTEECLGLALALALPLPVCRRC